MATTYSIQAKLGYRDGNDRTYNIPYVGTADMPIADVVQKVKDFNSAAGTEDSNVQQTFLSNAGARTTGIQEAVIVARTEEVLYHA